MNDYKPTEAFKSNGYFFCCHSKWGFIGFQHL